MYGIRRFVAVINPPQAAILAVGELTPRPVVRDGEVVVRALMELTLTCDHRILYGADAAEFLGRIREYLEHAAPPRALAPRRSEVQLVSGASPEWTSGPELATQTTHDALGRPLGS